jgi:DNA processing protein
MFPKTPIDDQEKLNRLRLIRSENVGPITFQQLLSRYKSAGAALEDLPRLAAQGGKKGRKLRIASQESAEREIAHLQRLGGTMLHLGQSDYPPLLAEIEDAPPVLNVLGHPGLLLRSSVGIVGSRNASTNGKRLTAQFASELSQAGYCIVSGLAYGIDAAAHHASLAEGTIAVVAGGPDVIYPKENTDLYHQIKERGVIVAEMPIGTVGQARHFPRRNRIISGISSAVLIIEATQRSGSLITARLAAEQGREVYALPGSPYDPRARGTNDLIRKGAGLVETPAELIRLLSEMPQLRLESRSGPDFEGPATTIPSDDAHLSEARTRIRNALGGAPVDINDLITDTGLPPSHVMTVLLELELAGDVERMSGNKVVLSYDQNIGTENTVQKNLFHES